MNKLQAGDQVAFRGLFDDYYDGLCDYAKRLYKDDDEGEEVVQDLFCKIWENRGQLNFGSSIKAYMLTSVRNRYLNDMNKEKVRRLAGEELRRKQSHEEMPAFELQEKVDEGYALLPEQCQKIFRMSREEGLKYGEIADKLGLSLKTVENQMGKGLRIFRTHLKDYLPLLLITLIDRLC